MFQAFKFIISLDDAISNIMPILQMGRLRRKACNIDQVHVTQLRNGRAGIFNLGESGFRILHSVLTLCETAVQFN